MNTRKKVCHVFILDESGSMMSIKEMIIEALNGIIASTRDIARRYPEQEHYVTFVTFNTHGMKTYLFNEPIEKLEFISGHNYIPQGGTPLYDAIGNTVAGIRPIIDGLMNTNALVSILTDGMENSSREYSGSDIAKLIEDLKSTGKWAFTYIGTEHAVEDSAKSMSISNAMYFQKSRHGIFDMLKQEVRSRANFVDKIRHDKDITENYYRDDEK